MVERLERLFPGLRGKEYQVTSPPCIDSNCIAWAAGDTRRWWWPDADLEDAWPPDAPREETLTAFTGAFATLGYAPCEHEGLEPGYEKIALFADAQIVPTHAARQLPNGRWSSKLGKSEDIEHELHDLAGEAYGSVVQVMKRPFPAVSAESTSQG